MSIPKPIRWEVWRTYIGRYYDGKCFVCDRNIDVEMWECGHVISHADGGTATTSNLRPICSVCNRSMGTRNMFEYMETHMTIGFIKFLNNDVSIDPTKNFVKIFDSDIDGTISHSVVRTYKIPIINDINEMDIIISDNGNVVQKILPKGVFNEDNPVPRHRVIVQKSSEITNTDNTGHCMFLFPGDAKQAFCGKPCMPCTDIYEYCDNCSQIMQIFTRILDHNIHTPSDDHIIVPQRILHKLDVHTIEILSKGEIIDVSNMSMNTGIGAQILMESEIEHITKKGIYGNYNNIPIFSDDHFKYKHALKLIFGENKAKRYENNVKLIRRKCNIHSKMTYITDTYIKSIIRQLFELDNKSFKKLSKLSDYEKLILIKIYFGLDDAYLTRNNYYADIVYIAGIFGICKKGGKIIMIQKIKDELFC